MNKAVVKATLVCRPGSSLFEVPIGSDTLIFLVFSTFPKAKNFIYDNNISGLFPITLDIMGLKNEFQSYSIAEKNNSFVAIDPESYPLERINAIKLKDLLDIQGDEINFNEYEIMWHTDGSAEVKSIVPST